MAVRDGGGQKRGMNRKGQTVSFPMPKGYKPTEAIVSSGQKPKGLGKPKKERFVSTAKTPVKKAGQGFAGSGGSLAQSFKMSEPTKPSNVANAALAATLLPGSGQVKKKVAEAVGNKAFRVADDAAFAAASKGLSASGKGGKVSRTTTPFGPTLRSTAIGTEKQQAARMSNLVANAERIGVQAGLEARRQARKIVVKAANKASQVKSGAATVAIGSQNQPKKKRK